MDYKKIKTGLYREKNAYTNTTQAKFLQRRNMSSNLQSRLFPSLTALYNTTHCQLILVAITVFIF